MEPDRPKTSDGCAFCCRLAILKILLTQCLVVSRESLGVRVMLNHWMCEDYLTIGSPAGYVSGREFIIPTWKHFGLKILPQTVSTDDIIIPAVFCGAVRRQACMNIGLSICYPPTNGALFRVIRLPTIPRFFISK